MSTPILPNLTTDGTTFDGSQTLPRGTQQWNASRYEEAVVATVARIRRNAVGQRVLAVALVRPVSITPWPDMSVQSATTQAHNHRRATLRGERQYYCADVPETRGHDETGRPVLDRARGTGEGTSARIRFTPQMWPRRPNQPAADEVLVHELVHAAQMTNGVMTCRAADGGYDTFAEFCAITTANMYRAVFYGRAGFQRRNHHGYQPRLWDPDIIRFYGPDPLDESEWSMLDRFQRNMPYLADPLAAMPEEQCPVNPFRRRDAGRRFGQLDSLSDFGPSRARTR